MALFQDNSKKYVGFTKSNVQRALRNVKKTDRLGLLLGVHERKLTEIKKQFPSNAQQQVKEYIDYLMVHCPFASWRRVVIALDRMGGEEEVVEDIRHLTESITDPTLTFKNLRNVTSSVKDWYRLGHYSCGLGVPKAVLNKIKFNSALKTEEEKKAAMLQYFLNNFQMASWHRVAGALFMMEESPALQSVKQFLPAQSELTLTSQNLSTVLHVMRNDLWRILADHLNLPYSEVERIRLQSNTDFECKSATIHSYISKHPAPSWELVAWVLYGWDDTSCLQCFELLQQLFPTGRIRSKQMYNKEMKYGHVELNLDKLLIGGMAGCGKTSVLATLLGVRPPDIRCSTPLLKRPIDLKLLDIDGNTVWTIRSLNEMKDKVAEVIHSRIVQQPEVEEGGTQNTFQKETESEKSSQPAVGTSAGNNTTHSSTSIGQKVKQMAKKLFSLFYDIREASAVGHESKEVGGVSLPQSSDVDEEMISLINTTQSSTEPIVRLRLFVVLDSGGQPEFLEMMPVFLNSASKFAYVFKLNESLDERMVIRFFRDGQLVWEGPASMTNDASLRLYMRTITSLNNKNPSIPPAKLMFVGTHRDKVPETKFPDVLDSVHKRLREILLPQFRDQIIFCDTAANKFVFPLNAAIPGEQDREYAESIRIGLSEVGQSGKEARIPLRWYTFYYKLIEAGNQLGKKVLPQNLCQQVAETLEMNSESCEEALDFFHRLNMLFYFTNILPSMVFVEPQMLLDKVSELVDETYQLRREEKGRPMVGEKLKFRDYAQVTEKYLNMFEKHYEALLFTAKELVILLKELLVFAEMSEGVHIFCAQFTTSGGLGRG